MLIGLILVIGTVSYLISGEKGMLLYLMMVTGMKNVPLERIFKVSFVTWSISFGGMALLTATHIIDSPFKIHDRFGFGFLIRWGLGHSHPNVLHISYLTFAMLAIYLLGKKINLKWLSLLMLGNLYIFLYSLSSTGFIAVCLLLLLNLYWLYRGKFAFFEKILIYSILPACLLLTFAAPLILTGRAFEIINKILNTRLNLTRHFLTTAPMTLFGTRTAEITSHWLTMDNSYLFAYATYGIILSALIITAYFLIIRRFIKAGKGMELSIIITCLFTGVIEQFLFNGSFKNISLLFFGELIFEKNPGRQHKIIKFLPSKISNYTLSFPDCSSVIKQKLAQINLFYHNTKRHLYLAFGIFAMIGIIIANSLMVLPDAYISPRKHCDEKEGEIWIYLDSQAVAEAEAQNKKVLQYIDEKTVMLEFSGNIVTLEWLRGVVTAGILSGLTGIAVVFIVLRWRYLWVKE